VRARWQVMNTNHGISHLTHEQPSPTLSNLLYLR
jgi:hypothetical protein